MAPQNDRSPAGERTDPTDDATGEEGAPPASTDGGDGSEAGASDSPADRLRDEADRAIAGFDEGVVDLLAWVLDTETRARIYVHLRQEPWSTSQEVADGTGLYPSTVREALAELHGEERVDRRKRESRGAGNNPYEYTAIAPSELVAGFADRIQRELNALIALDDRLGGDEGESSRDAAPVTITIDEIVPSAGTTSGPDTDRSEGDVEDAE